MWIILAVIAAFIFAICNVVDKFVLTKWVRQPFVPVIIMAFIGLIAGLIVPAFHHLGYLSAVGILLSFVAGIMFILGSVFYFKALQMEEVSRVIPLYYISPLVVMLFAAIFLHERLTGLNYLGIILVVFGAIAISSKSLGQIKLGKAFPWIMLSVLGYVSNQVLTKYLLNFTDFWTIFFYIRIGALIGAIPIIYIYFPELIRTVKQFGSRVVSLISLNESLNIISVLLITVAISIGSVTLVESLQSVQQFFVLVIAIAVSVFYPRILKEELGKSVIALKVLAIVSMFVGVLLIT